MLSVSISQMRAYSACPKQWELQKLIRAPFKTGLNRVMGKSIHSGVELFNGALSKGETPNSDAVISRFERELLGELSASIIDEEYSKYLEDSEAKTPMTKERFQKKLESDHLDLGKKLLLQFIARTDHGTEFKFIETHLEYVLRVDGEEVLFRYVPDVVDVHNGKYRLRDYKTKGKEDSKFSTLQLTGYSYLLKEQHGIEVAEIDQLSFIKSKKDPRIQCLSYDMSRLPEDTAIFKEELSMFIKGIRAGVFPRNPDNIFCTSCDYREVCLNPSKKMEIPNNSQSSGQEGLEV